MATLGTLAAGIAHELNNPASAASSTSQYLMELMEKYEQAQSNLRLLNLQPRDESLIADLSHFIYESWKNKHSLKQLEFIDRENEIEDWIVENNFKGGLEFAAPLVEMGFDAEKLGQLIEQYNKEIFFLILISLVYRFQINELLTELKKASGRISEIVKAMKSYTFLDQAAVQNVNVNEGLDNTLIILGSRMQGVQINKEYGKLPLITAYGSELNQVWTNIIVNAIDAMKRNGKLTIRTYVEKKIVVVEIEDNGPGIPVGIQSRIFDPFFTTKEPGKGTGLGLSTAYGIITDKHKGAISVQSLPGTTNFMIRLPV